MALVHAGIALQCTCMPAQIIDRELVYNRWSKVTEATLRLPNGAVETRIIEDHGCAAAVLLYNIERRVALLVTQPRAPVLQLGQASVLEVVAGRAEHGSDEATARAEALEEAGVIVQQVERIATAWSLPAMSTERISLSWPNIAIRIGLDSAEVLIPRMKEVARRNCTAG